MSSGARLFVLDPTRVAVYRQQSGRWELESSLPIQHSRIFPRDVRGRLVASAAIICSTSTCPEHFAAPAPRRRSHLPARQVTIRGRSRPTKAGSTAVRAFYAPARNFFTGALSPGIGKISNVPSFYAAAARFPRRNYTLWMLAAVDGSIHMIDGITDQAIRSGPLGKRSGRRALQLRRGHAASRLRKRRGSRT